MLELRDLACVRGEARLFAGLSASLRPGGLLRVLGGNGAGKTSLLRMICGLATPARGAVFWRGEPVQRLREEFGRELVYLGHAAALKDDLSGRENLRLACALGGHAAGEGEADAALAAAGLAARSRLPARSLSQGQRRRVALARLAIEPAAALWVLDEPFNALDAAATEWLLGLVGAQLGRGGMVVLTSHQSVALAPSWTQSEVAL